MKRGKREKITFIYLLSIRTWWVAPFQGSSLQSAGGFSGDYSALFVVVGARQCLTPLLLY